MISVSDALSKLFALADPMPVEEVPLLNAGQRVLAQDALSRRDQPPFDASSMDGYALQRIEAYPGAKLTVIGEAAAGHRFDKPVHPGEAVRIFTGAPVPVGADCVVIQEDVTRDGDQITLGDALGDGRNIRPAGADFRSGDRISAPRLLKPEDIALLASMNIARVPVARKPVVSLIATGDELVMPGDAPNPDQIIASNNFGLYTALQAWGAAPRLLPIARDSRAALETVLDLARDSDLILTIGGASVGDHDIVAQVMNERGMDRAFYKVAMRPGKPLMAGRLGNAMMIGLPGNPVSAMVCGHVFVAPVIRAMLGLGQSAAPWFRAPLGADISANGPREHYMRARFSDGEITPFDRQDSSLLTVLSDANALLIRPPGDPARQKGEIMSYISLEH